MTLSALIAKLIDLEVEHGDNEVIMQDRNELQWDLIEEVYVKANLVVIEIA